VLAVNFIAGGIPVLNVDARWEGQEQAVLLVCSSLIAIIEDDYVGRVVQFSHFSVKEYLTSDRLAESNGLASHYRIRSEPANMVVAQACLAVLLMLDIRINQSSEYLPLARYAALHFGDYVELESMLSHLQGGLGLLFDEERPRIAS
jgi:hypothetical protein